MRMKQITELARTIDVIAETEVLVVGSGPGGPTHRMTGTMRHISMDRAGIKRFTRGALMSVIGLALLSGCGTFATSPDRTPKVVFIIVDGIPADVIERTPTPVLDEIAAEGAYTRAYVGGTVGQASESPTISAVGYNSLLTGTWADKHNVWDNSVENPDYHYWDIFRIAKAYNPRLQTAIFSTWQDNRTRLLGDGIRAAGGHKLDFYYDGFELDTDRFPHDEAGDYIGHIDTIVADEAARYIREVGPDLSWIYLENTDHVAHRFGDGPEFASAVRTADEQVGLVWHAIQERRAKYQEDWLILVTTDHGRDLETGKDHGGQSARERTTWIATNSQRLNDRFRQSPAIVDILPSIATHLGLRIRRSVLKRLDGKSFIN
jgi:predicted AlkP superfamily pyrophosphatase or phosphodiesterase